MVARKRMHLRIRGQVQGVSFRWYGGQRASSLGLSGWIRNCPDGSVETVAEGPADAVSEFVAWAKRGPAMAAIGSVEEDEQTPTGDASPFTIRH
jgi:acylphosphatase